MSIARVVEEGRIEREFDFFRTIGIAPFSKEIVNRILSKPSPCMLVAPTGYGKTVGIPYAIIRAGYKVMIGLPTVALCDNLYNNVIDRFPTLKVGKAYEREVSIPANAQMIIASNGYLKNRLLGFVQKGVCASIDSTFADVLFLDEVHLAKLDMTIIISLWFYCSNRFGGEKRFPRLVLSSATPGTISPLGGVKSFGRNLDLCVVIPEKLPKTVYNIDDHWQNDYPVKSAARYKDMGILLKDLHNSTDISERIMIFVPGKGEMDKVLQASEIEDEVDVVKVMSSSSVEDQEVLRRKVDLKRLVILSTPSGDAGMNIDKLVHVLDSMLIKNSVEISNGTVDLQTEFISKALSKQRRGRVGRNTDGHYYPFCTEQGYNQLEENYPSEISRLPLYKTILELNAHGIEVDDILGVYNVPRLKKDIDDLIKWGLLRRSKHSRQLYSTAAGLFLAKLEIESPKLGSVLYAWTVFEYPLEIGVILVNLISFVTSEIFLIPSFSAAKGEPAISAREMMRRRTEFMNSYFKRFVGRTEVHTAVNIWNAMVSEVGVNSPMENIEAWCKNNHLSSKLIKTVIKTIQKATSELGGDVAEISTRIGIVEHLKPLRRFFEYIYRDSIANKQGDVFVINSTAEVVKVSSTGTTMMNTYDNSATIPTRLVVISKRKVMDNIVVDQSLDLDNPQDITDITVPELVERLKVFN